MACRMIRGNRLFGGRGRAAVAESCLAEGEGLCAMEREGQKLRGTSAIRRSLIQGVSSSRPDG